jgi:hypothetical protein
LLIEAAQFDRAGADGDEFNQAYGALKSLADAQDLYDKAARLYRDPKIRATYGDAAVEEAWDNPAVAKALLLKESAAGRLPQEAHEALSTIYEVEALAAEHSVSLPQPGEAPIPSDARGVEAEIQGLLGKLGKSPAEHARLTALYEATVARQDREAAAAEAASGPEARPSEYDSLIQKSVSGGLSDAENARLDQLAEQRAVDAGLAEPEDFTGTEE